jgi:sugar phosphate isomerase/epimerase
MLEVEYPEIGTILNSLGFDGCDLAVQPGGTVAPDQSPVDMVRAIETLTGEGLEVPVITTAFFSVAEPWARNVLALCGRSGVPFFRSGYSRYPERLVGHGNEVAALVAYGRAAGIGLGLPYPAAEVLIRDMDRDWAGYDFDPSQGKVESALSRIRMVVLRDVRREGGLATPCPLGEGSVDWPGFFGVLAHARFSGPLTLTIAYPAPDRLEAIRRDLAFARKHLNAAYEKELDPTSHRPSAVSPGAIPPA